MALVSALGAWIEAAQANGSISRKFPAIAVLYTLYARACDPVLEFLQMGGQHSPDEIIDLVLRLGYPAVTSAADVEAAVRRSGRGKHGWNDVGVAYELLAERKRGRQRAKQIEDAALLAEGGVLRIRGVGLNPTRTGFLRVLARMGYPETDRIAFGKNTHETVILKRTTNPIFSHLRCP